MDVLIDGWGPVPALGAHRHSGTNPWNSQRARRVALAREVVSEDHVTRSKLAPGAIANPNFHLPHENKNVLSPGRGVPIAPIVRRETAEHEVRTRLKRNVVALLSRQREVFKMGLAVLPRIYPYNQHIVILQGGVARVVTDAGIQDMSFLATNMYLDGNALKLYGNRWLKTRRRPPPSGIGRQ
jgi:hypothetical protein